MMIGTILVVASLATILKKAIEKNSAIAVPVATKTDDKWLQIAAAIFVGKVEGLSPSEVLMHSVYWCVKEAGDSLDGLTKVDEMPSSRDALVVRVYKIRADIAPTSRMEASSLLRKAESEGGIQYGGIYHPNVGAFGEGWSR